MAPESADRIQAVLDAGQEACGREDRVEAFRVALAALVESARVE